METGTDIISEQLLSRGGVYRLLGRLWQREADKQLLHHLRTPALRTSLEAVGGVVPVPKPSTLNRLAEDYCQLFIGPSGHLPPFQSVWQSGQFCGDALASMRSYVDIARYDAGEDESGMLDHLGKQLDLMAHILESLAQVPGQRASCEDLPEAYFHAHLTWPTPLLEAVNNRAQTPFYRSLASMTKSFLHGEASTEQFRRNNRL